MSESVHDQFSFLAHYSSEEFLKRLIRKTDVEDALLWLDSLTKEESLMAVAKNLEVTHQVKILAEDIDGKVRAIDRVDKNVKVVKERTQLFPSLVMHAPTLFLIVSQNRSG